MFQLRWPLFRAHLLTEQPKVLQDRAAELQAEPLRTAEAAAAAVLTPRPDRWLASGGPHPRSAEARRHLTGSEQLLDPSQRTPADRSGEAPALQVLAAEEAAAAADPATGQALAVVVAC